MTARGIDGGNLLSLFKEVNGGWEDVNAGTLPQDDEHPIVVVEPEPAEPVQMTPMTNEQPTELDKIPIDDEDYEPTHADELGRATRLLFRDLPDEVSGWMWKKVRALKDKVEMSMHDDDVGGTKVEAIVRKLVREVLLNETVPRNRLKKDKRRVVGAKSKSPTENPLQRDVEDGVYSDEGPSAADLAAIEAGDDWDLPDEELVEPDAPQKSAYGARYGRGKSKKSPMAVMALSDADADMLAAISAKADESEMDPADKVAEEEEAESEHRKKKYITAGDEGMSLGDIAKKLGYSGPSGVKNLLYKIEDRMQYFASLDEVWFKRLMTTFAKAYVEELKDAVGENLTTADVNFLDDLMDEPDTVLQLPGFRMWAVDYLKTIHKEKSGKKPKDR